MRHALILVLALVVPAAGNAAEFCGWVKETTVCSDIPVAVKTTRSFCLELDPGAGFGVLATLGSEIDVVTDWWPNGSFAASGFADGVGTFIYSGTIKGTKLKGAVSHHYYAGCLFTGSLSAGLVP